MHMGPLLGQAPTAAPFAIFFARVLRATFVARLSSEVRQMRRQAVRSTMWQLNLQRVPFLVHFFCKFFLAYKASAKYLTV